MHVHVRNAVIDDLPRLVRVAGQSFLEMGRRPERFASVTIEAILRWPDHQFVAAVGDEICGFLVGEPLDGHADAATILWIATHPSWRGRSIGRNLLQAFEEFAGRYGYRRIWLGTPFAAGFYEAQGYRPVGIVHRLVRDVTACAIDRRPDDRMRPLHFEDIEPLLASLPADDHARFLRGALGTYPPDQLCGRTYRSPAGSLGIWIAHEDRYASDLIVPLYQYFEDHGCLEALLTESAYVTSIMGRRWAGFITESTEERAVAETLGWRESQLHSFWMQFNFEKPLK